MDIRTHIDGNGRLLLPVEIRRKYNLNNGSPVVIRIINDEIKLVNVSQIIAETRDLVRQYIPKNIDLVSQLRDTREQEAILENKDHKSSGSSKNNKWKA